MNSLFHLSVATLGIVFLTMSSAHAIESIAPHHDLVFGLNSEANQPFFQDGTFMLGDKLITVEEGPLPASETVAYDAKADKIIVSNDKTISEADKGAAVLQLMDAMSIQAIEPAAGH